MRDAAAIFFDKHFVGSEVLDLVLDLHGKHSLPPNRDLELELGAVVRDPADQLRLPRLHRQVPRLDRQKRLLRLRTSEGRTNTT